jgi:hypothetical protein
MEKHATVKFSSSPFISTVSSGHTLTEPDVSRHPAFVIFICGCIPVCGDHTGHPIMLRPKSFLQKLMEKS